MAIQDTDLFLVDRNNTNYKVEAQDIMAIEDTDLLLVDRGGTNYKLEASELKDYISPDLSEFFNFYTSPFGSTQYPQYGNMQASENCICVLSNNGIYRSTDGINWTKVSDARSRNDVTYTPGVYAGGPQGIAYGGNGIWVVYQSPNLGSLRSIDNGITWNPITIPTLSSFGGIAGAFGGGNSNFFIANNSTATLGGASVSYVSTDGALTWTQLASLPVNTSPIGSQVCINVAGTTVNGSAVFGAMTNTTIPGAAYSTFYISTNLGNTWTSIRQNSGRCSGIGAGNGVICFSSVSGDSGDTIASATYYNGTSYTIPLVNGFNRPGGLEAGVTTFASGDSKIMAQGYQGTTEFVVVGTSPVQYSSVSQSNLIYPSSASVYFKNRFYYFDPFLSRIAYTK